MLNETINATNLSGFSYIKEVTAPQILERLHDIIIAPTKNHDMIWMIVPLVVVLLLMEFYFGRYKKEELGWNTALGNSLVLVFISIDLLRYLYNQYGNDLLLGVLNGHDKIKLIVVVIIIMEGIVLLFYDFFHFLPKKLAFFIGSALPVNLQAYLGIVLVYSDNIPFDWITIGAALVMFFILLLFFSLIHLFQTGVDSEGKPLPWEEDHPWLSWIRDRHRKIIKIFKS